MVPYRFTNLTSAVRDSGSPLRRYLARQFPHVRPLQREYREGAGELLVDTGGANPAVLGAAFDFQVRFTIDPSLDPTIAVLAFLDMPAHLASIESVIRIARSAARTAGPHDDTVARACWVLAWCTDVYRAGRVVEHSPLARLIGTDRFTPEILLSLAPPDAIRQLAALREIADRDLLPHLGRPIVSGPSFDASALCNADADLIAGGVLIDIKTHLGPKNPRTGVRSDRLSLVDLYQTVAYVLFDYSDSYRLTGFGIYSARYGHLATWPLDEGLATLAGEPVDLRAERDRVWALLGGRFG